MLDIKNEADIRSRGAVVGMGLGFESALRSGAHGLQLVLSGVAGGLLLGVAGIVFFGWAMLPITLLAALVWAFVIRRVTPPASKGAG